MNFNLYLACLGVAFVGMAVQTVLKLISLQNKARAANIKFNPGIYFKTDWLSISASFLTIIFFLLIIDNVLKWKPQIIDFVKILFGFVGYTGSDIASRLFGVVNTRINKLIDSIAGPAQGPLTEIPKTKIE